MNSYFMRVEDINEILPGQLFMSDITTAENLDVLHRLSITHIVSCTKIEPRHPDKFTYKQLPVDDTSEEDIKKYFKMAVKFIESAIENEGGVVLVHCAAGISRSGAVVCAYLMYKNRWSFDRAWELENKKEIKCIPI
eukprot:403373242